MTNIETMAKEYREYKRMIEELQALQNAIADEIKAVMTEAGETKMIIGEYKISYSDCTRKDLDKKRLEQDLGSLDEYLKITQYKRFSIA